VAVYRVNAGRVPAGHWTLAREIGGGRIVGELCHMLDLLAWWLGPEVVAWTATGVSPSASSAETAQEVAVGLRMRDAAGTEHLASLTYLSVGARDLPKESIEIHAGGGSLRLDDFAQLAVHGLAAKPATLRRPDKGHRAEIAAFRDAIRGRSGPLLGVEEAYRAADLALRIDEAVSGQS
jgi:polar amino acid transport system substrate-binding protein